LLGTFSKENAMSEYSMTCSCGDEMKVEAGTREEAVSMLKGFMTEGAVKAHMAEKHPGEPVPAVKDIHAQIAANVELAMA
jgi:hypothetical protein